MDTVFHFYNESANIREVYILCDWGAIDNFQLQEWILHLWQGVPDTNGNAAPVCQFDLDNLTWSAKAMKNSITLKLWGEIEAELPYGASGPEIFPAVVSRMQHVSASASRALVQQLQGLKLTKEWEMNVDTFSRKLLDMVDRISGCDEKSIPSDLSVIVAQCFLGTGIDEFALEVTQVFNQVDKNPGSMNARAIVTTLKTKYRSLDGRNLWPHKKKQGTDDLTAMKGTINKLQQTIQTLQTNSANAGGGANQGQSQSKGSKDLSNIECHNCHKKGHYARNCPDKQTQGSQQEASAGEGKKGPWWKKPPANGKPEEMAWNGEVYLWCGKCMC